MSYALPTVEVPAYNPAPVREIEEVVMNAWLLTGAIKETCRGNENVYFENEFGMQFFCKCL